MNKHVVSLFITLFLKHNEKILPFFLSYTNTQIHVIPFEMKNCLKLLN